MKLPPPAAVVVALLSGACGHRESAPADSPGVVATFTGGKVTRAELDREGGKLPPLLKHQFESPAGRRELAQSLVDKRLLVERARKLGFADDPELHRQVVELEERLMVQAMLAREEQALPQPTEADERAWYEAHKDELADPEKVRVGRLLAAYGPQTPAADKAKAKARAAQLLKELKAGAPLAKLLSRSDGPEKARGGEIALFARGQLSDPALERASFALKKAGEISPVVETKEGASVVVLLEHRPARIPAFAEVQTLVRDRLEPLRKRKAFDELRAELRKQNNVKLDEGALK